MEEGGGLHVSRTILRGKMKDIKPSEERKSNGAFPLMGPTPELLTIWDFGVVFSRLIWIRIRIRILPFKLQSQIVNLTEKHFFTYIFTKNQGFGSTLI
jgi:hypothetical protein